MSKEKEEISFLLAAGCISIRGNRWQSGEGSGKNDAQVFVRMSNFRQAGFLDS